MLQTATFYGLLNEVDGAHRISPDLSEELAIMVSRLVASNPNYKIEDMLQIFVDLCKYRVLSTDKGQVSQVYLLVTLLHYALSSLGWYEILGKN